MLFTYNNNLSHEIQTTVTKAPQPPFFLNFNHLYCLNIIFCVCTIISQITQETSTTRIKVLIFSVFHKKQNSLFRPLNTLKLAQFFNNLSLLLFKSLHLITWANISFSIHYSNMSSSPSSTINMTHFSTISSVNIQQFLHT